MSTRSCIARVTGEGTFTGVYHHWDGYPTALGKTLFSLHRGFFKGDLNAMLAFLIDEHPAGWSTINGANFAMPAGYHSGTEYKKKPNGDSDYSKPIPHGPVCFCHGGRHEEASEVDQDADLGMEWAYVFDTDKNVMFVLERLYTDDAGSGTKLFSGEKVLDVGGHHMTGLCGSGAPGHQRWAVAAEVDLKGKEPKWKEINAKSYNGETPGARTATGVKAMKEATAPKKAPQSVKRSKTVQ